MAVCLLAATKITRTPCAVTTASAVCGSTPIRARSSSKSTQVCIGIAAGLDAIFCSLVFCSAAPEGTHTLANVGPTYLALCTTGTRETQTKPGNYQTRGGKRCDEIKK